MAAAGGLAVVRAAAGQETGLTRPPAALAAARQLVLVTATGWDVTTGTLRRYARAAPGAPWRPVGAAVPVVLGRTGLAWGAGEGGGGAMDGAPVKQEGDGRSPAGAFPLVAAFGYGGGADAARLPFHPVAGGTVCVDDPGSPLYNAVVDSADAGGARWASAERMREVAGYRRGVVVGYNGARVGASRRAAPPPTAAAGGAPRPGLGSCIFLHVWDGPDRPTAGCTAMADSAMAGVVAWLDPGARPALVQLPAAAAARVARGWGLPR
jgi:L,D-peptidoglycan transpeptidase YkuD (ErfK/YbiS/YcfS/YnhG family)